MVEIQDSVEDKSSESEEDNVAERYIRRRGLDTSTPFTSQVVDVGYIEGTGRIGVEIKTPDFDFVVDLGEHKRSVGSNLVTFMSNCPRELVIDGELAMGKEFDSWFSKDLRRFGFKNDSKRFHVIMDDLPDLEGDVSDVVSDILPYYEYKRRSDEKPGIRRTISHVETEDKDKLKIETDIHDKRIEWLFEIPFQVDIDDHPVTSFIEEQGSGDPRNLNGSTAYVVHKSDIVGRINPVGYDSSREWALVKPSSYEKWNPSSYSTNTLPKPEAEDTMIFALMYISYILFAMLFLILVSEISSLIF